MDVETEVTLALNISLDVCHLVMIVDPVDNKVWEPRILSTDLEKFIEKLEALLSKVVTENFETHQRLVLRKGLSKQSESHVVDLIVSHV